MLIATRISLCLVATLTLAPELASAENELATVVDTLAMKVKSASTLPIGAEETVSVSFVKPGNDPWRFGILQKIRVAVPLARLVQVIDDTSGYVGLFQDLKKTERRDISGPDDYTLFTETEIPLPLAPNDKTSMRYHVDRGQGHALYRFRLVEGNHLNAYEGVALAAADGPAASTYWELDLYEPGFGMSRALPVKKFWVQNALASAQSCWAWKLRAENAGTKAETILDDSSKRADALESKISAAYDAPLALSALMAQAAPASPSPSASAKKPRSPAPSTAKPKQRGPKSEPSP